MNVNSIKIVSFGSHGTCLSKYMKLGQRARAVYLLTWNVIIQSKQTKLAIRQQISNKDGWNHGKIQKEFLGKSHTLQFRINS